MSTKPRTIGRNATRQIAALRRRQDLTCRIYTLENYFHGEVIAPSAAWDALDRWCAQLRDNGNGTYTVHVHSNCWFELRPVSP
jgi:hypothetical protein